MEVIDLHPCPNHEIARDRIAQEFVSGPSRLRPFGDRRCGGKDQVCTSPPEAIENPGQVALVVGHGSNPNSGYVQFPVLEPLDIVQSEIEMDQVPWFFTEPSIEPLQTVLGVSSVLGNSMNICICVQNLANRDGVTDGDGISDQKNPWDIGPIFYRAIGGMGGVAGGNGIHSTRRG